MKKLWLLLFVFALAACSEEMPASENESTNVVETVEAIPDLSMETIISAYEDAGIAVDPEEKQAFGMIDAIDGVIFYNNNNPVKIYEYASEDAMTAAAEYFPTLNEWDKNGLFVLETSDDEAKEIFNSVE